MTSKEILKGLIKKIDNEYATIAEDGIIGGDVHGYVNSGCFALNALISGSIYGGFPRGKVSALAGAKGSGKTFILFKAVKEFLDEKDTNLFILFESEGAITRQMLDERGIDMSRVLNIPIMTVEELRNQAVTILKSFEEMDDDRPDILLGLDSLGMLSTEFEIKTSSENTNKADMGKRAQLIKSVFRLLTMKLGIMHVPMIITNHIYSTMSAYSADKMGGGTGLEFASSIIVYLNKSADKDKDKKTIIGNIVKCTLHKGRFTIEGSRADLLINFKHGMNRYYYMLDIALEYKLMHRSGKNYYLGKKKDPDQLVAGSKNEVYIKGKEIFNEEMLQKIDEVCDEKYRYGALLEDEEELQSFIEGGDDDGE